MAVFGRNKKDEAEEVTETISLNDENHAWWAAREDLSRAWQPKKRGGAGAGGADSEPASQFEREFSSESLFNWGDGTNTHTESATYTGKRPFLAADGSDPYYVLGVSPHAPWNEIVAAHRHLAKMHHPDRLLEASPEERAESEHTMRLVNAAYLQLRRHHEAR